MGFSDVVQWLFSHRYIAGQTIEDAVERCKRLNALNIRCVLNYLGEEITHEDDVKSAVLVYKKMIDAIKSRRLAADISVKPTEMGLLIGSSDAKKHYSEIVEYAARRKVFVWMDMEERKFVEPSIRLYLTKVKRGNTGICIQSYLLRSGDDLENLAKHKATVRLVKGAYGDDPQHAYANRRETTDNYYVLMNYLFQNFRRFTIGTHDTRIIERGMRLNRKWKRDVTYAMLLGIRSGYLRQLGASGAKVAVYVPFGRAWIRYAYRRLKEASNLKLFISSLFDKFGA